MSDDLDQGDTPTLAERQEMFLELLRTTGVRDGDAAEIVGVHRVTAYRWRQNPEFAARYEEAKKIRLETLIKEAERRAVAGSDRLLEFLLCNYAPDKFSNKQKLEHGGNMPLIVVTGVPDDDGSDLAG